MSWDDVCEECGLDTPCLCEEEEDDEEEEEDDDDS